MLISRHATMLTPLAAPADRPTRDAAELARREVLAVLFDPRTAIGLGMSGQFVFIAAVLATSERWLSLTSGLTAIACSLSTYGSSLVLGHLTGLRHRMGSQ